MEHLLPGLFEILLNFKFSVRFVKIQEVQLYVSVLCKVGLWFAYGPASRFCVLSVHIEFSRSYKKKTKSTACDKDHKLKYNIIFFTSMKFRLNQTTYMCKIFRWCKTPECPSKPLFRMCVQ